MKTIENLFAVFHNKHKYYYMLWLLFSFIVSLALVLIHIIGKSYFYTIFFGQITFMFLVEYLYFNTKKLAYLYVKNLLVSLFSIGVFILVYFILSTNSSSFSNLVPILPFSLILPLTLAFTSFRFSQFLILLQLLLMLLFATFFWFDYNFFVVYNFLFYLNFWLMFWLYLVYKKQKTDFLNENLPLNYPDKLWKKSEFAKHLKLELKIANTQNTALGIFIFEPQVALDYIDNFKLDFECLFELSPSLYLLLVFELNQDTLKRRLKFLQKELKSNELGEHKLSEALDANLATHAHLAKINSTFNLEIK